MHKPLPPQPREIGAVNWIGLWTLFRREVQRFLKVYQQTVAAPVVTTLLFYAVFALALGGNLRMVGETPFLQFLAPGLIMMAMAQNAFANTSSSVIIAKVQGNIVDVLMPPLAPAELALGYVMGGVCRGLAVGIVTAIAISLFVPLEIAAPFYIVYHAVMASMLLSLLGLIGGVWAEKFDHIAAFTNFLITPLTFLSGTFYSVERLPTAFWWVAHANPFFYMIDGFRYGFIGVSDGTLGVGLALLAGTNLALWALLLRMLSTGYKLKP
ncbi:ABC transporter permease [Arenibaculum pallidiluteum]|uniref:ABC transporter permease n=1 Tax=Arenibaculum pallidiluteum TaxID=2812559 RepID=UPI001A977A11|nr:ABC transporter permease [Arenibaculum pallidiluteum]